MRFVPVTVSGTVLALIFGYAINVITLVLDVAKLETIGEASVFNAIQVVSIFLGPIGSIVGYIYLFV